ncbi:YdgH/BhsA/McbA-like domain containing protein [Sodalis glossinidius]|uniref:YdgH/BhsA/McbA-like domain containing protein n=1 Tax=Sodalis glossinidius TaxID=63612 RepID=UPI0002E6151B|nr:YdgH/BhsA/McbA-like domain containing protein [Sodalis glossinidius]
MKMTFIAATALILATYSFPILAAQDVTSPPPGQQPMGTVSATTYSSSVTDLQQQLEAKADEANASFYRITSAGGTDTLSGTAELYK